MPRKNVSVFYILLALFVCSLGSFKMADAMVWQYHPVDTFKAPWHYVGQQTWQTGDDAHHFFLQVHLYPNNDMEMHVYIPNSYQPKTDAKSALIFYDLKLFPNQPVQEFKTSFLGKGDSLQDSNLYWNVFTTQRTDRHHLAQIIRKGTSLAWIVFNNNQVVRLYDPSCQVPKPIHRDWIDN